MSAARRAWAALRHRPLGPAALVCLAVLVAAVIAAPWLATYDPTAIDLDHVLSGPSTAHPLGADALGRDILSRLLYGGQLSLWGVVEAVAAVLAVGVPLGLSAGLYGGLFDRAASVVTDIVLAIPVVVTLLVVVAFFGSSQTAAMLTLGVLGAPGVARVVRGATLAVMGETWVAAARVAGLRNARILVRHLLPRVAGPIIVQASIFAGVAVIAETGLSYLGLGVQPPTPTWGGMVAEASMVIERQPWSLLPSGGVIALTVISLGVVGDLARDAAVVRAPMPRPAGAVRRRAQASPAPAASGGGALLSVRGISMEVATRTGSSTVVDGAWLDILPGETVGLVGESGCGKTMTGRAILGLLPPAARMTAGSILFDGRDIACNCQHELRRVRGRQIALIAQQSQARLDPCFTVGRQVAEMVGREIGNRSAVRRRVYELLASVNLPDPEKVARRYPHELSGGMAQRVSIAMALAKRPRLLIADEPTTALDGTVQAEILDLLRGLQAGSGMSILLITHDWGVVADICERAYVMYAGHVMEAASTTVLMGHSRHPYTLGLLGSMVQGVAPRHRLPAIAGAVPDPSAWPRGCHFEPRCPMSTPECAAGPVPLAEPRPGHHTRCLRHDAIRREGEYGYVRSPA